MTAVPNPMVSAIVRKKSGATKVAAASASVPSVPMNAVSAIRYVVWTAIPAIMGNAMIQSARRGASRNSSRRSVRVVVPDALIVASGWERG